MMHSEGYELKLATNPMSTELKSGNTGAKIDEPEAGTTSGILTVMRPMRKHPQKIANRHGFSSEEFGITTIVIVHDDG